MAEYDALPDIGHGCGHNVICSSALAAGIGLGAVAAEAGGMAVVVGTPAEETDGAKVYMSDKGSFDELDAALMVHPYAGSYYVTESLAMDAIELEFTGKPAHSRGLAVGRPQRPRRGDPDLQRRLRAPPADAARRPRARDHHRGR